MVARQIPDDPRYGVARVIVGFYLLFGLAGLGLIIWRVDETRAFDPSGLGAESWPLFTAVAGLLVLAVHAASLIAVRRWRTLMRGINEMRQWLGRLSRGETLAVALASGVGEEIFFRGWLLNETGLLVSSLIFGAVHIPPTRNWLYWPLFAFLMGLLLGWLCLWTDSLIYAVLVHAGINFINILRLPADR